MTQCEQVLDYIDKHGAITQLDAERFGCRRLASRVCDLKKQGYGIISRMVDVGCRDGRTVKVARYEIGTDGERKGEEAAN